MYEDVDLLGTYSSRRIHTKAEKVRESTCDRPCLLHWVEEELELPSPQACSV